MKGDGTVNMALMYPGKFTSYIHMLSITFTRVRSEDSHSKINGGFHGVQFSFFFINCEF